MYIYIWHHKQISHMLMLMVKVLWHHNVTQLYYNIHVCISITSYINVLLIPCMNDCIITGLNCIIISMYALHHEYTYTMHSDADGKHTVPLWQCWYMVVLVGYVHIVPVARYLSSNYSLLPIRLAFHNHHTGLFVCWLPAVTTDFYLGISQTQDPKMLGGRADSRLALSQWETSLQSNAVSHWLGAILESALWRYTSFPRICSFDVKIEI